MRAIILGAALWALAAGPTAAVAPDECEQQRAMFPKDWNDVEQGATALRISFSLLGQWTRKSPLRGSLLQANLQSWASPLLAPFEGPLSTNSTRCSVGLAVLVPVFAVLGSHQQGRAVQSLRRQAESCVSRIPPDREETAFLRQA